MVWTLAEWHKTVTDFLRKELFFYDAAQRQMHTLQALALDDWRVVSSHHSKSCQLPVVRGKLGETGIEVMIRGNFYDWNVSVVSEIPINRKALGYDTSGEDCFFEGFPEEWRFGMPDDRHFSVSLPYRVAALATFIEKLWEVTR